MLSYKYIQYYLIILLVVTVLHPTQFSLPLASRQNSADPLDKLAQFFPCDDMNKTNEDWEQFKNETYVEALVGYKKVLAVNNSEGIEWPMDDSYLHRLLGKASSSSIKNQGTFFLISILSSKYNQSQERFNFVDQYNDRCIHMTGNKICIRIFVQYAATKYNSFELIRL